MPLEHGLEAQKGAEALLGRLVVVLEHAENPSPFGGRALLRELADEVGRLNERVVLCDAQLGVAAQRLPACHRSMTIPGNGAGRSGR